MNEISTDFEKKSDLLREFLFAEEIHPVLVDIGSAGKRHQIWDLIAGLSTLVAFDPDARQAPVGLVDLYQRVIMVDKAVCASDEQAEVEFILTQYPSCSSTLMPNMAEVSGYSFASYFTPVDKVRVPATSINRVIPEHGLGQIDWIKIDSQGTDLRILRSISAEHFGKVCAVDVEPGWVNAYAGEDLFSQVHEFLVHNGFWLSDLRSQHYPRVTGSSLDDLRRELPEMTEHQIKRSIKGSPTAAEARYLRRIDSLENSGRRQLLVLFAFSLLDGHFGFAADVAAEMARSRGDARVAMEMRRMAAQFISMEQVRSLSVSQLGGSHQSVRQLLRRTIAMLGPAVKRSVRSLLSKRGP